MSSTFRIPPLAELRWRRSAKWQTFPHDVLPLPVAEMDFPLAEPVAAALHQAIRHSDTGYAAPTADLAKAVAGYAHRTWNWPIDPEGAHTVADVGIGIVETLRRIVAPGDKVVISPPVYEPFSWWVQEVGAQVVEAPLTETPTADGTARGLRLDLDTLERAFVGGGQGVPAVQPAQSARPGTPA